VCLVVKAVKKKKAAQQLQEDEPIPAQQQGHIFNDAPLSTNPLNIPPPVTGFGNPLFSHQADDTEDSDDNDSDSDSDRRSERQKITRPQSNTDSMTGSRPQSNKHGRKSRWQKQAAVKYRQYDGEGTHFNLGLSLTEIEEALDCMLPWDSYTRDESRFSWTKMASVGSTSTKHATAMISAKW
jgi:hypothetical protein